MANTPIIAKASSEDTRVYECAVLFPANLSDKEYQDALKEIESLFTEKGATLIHKDEWGRRGLAYKIKGHTEGKYVVWHWEMEPKHIRDTEAALLIEKMVLRHLLIRVDDGYEIQNWSVLFKEWLEQREKEEEEAEKEREEELKKKIVQKVAKKAPAATPVVEQATEPSNKAEVAEEVSEEELGEKLDEIISDEDLKL